MELNNKITIKKFIANHPNIARMLGRKNSNSIDEMAKVTGLSPDFITLHLDTIKRWI